eukprot:5066972-Pyramimonas_sp.AAC.1
MRPLLPIGDRLMSGPLFFVSVFDCGRIYKMPERGGGGDRQASAEGKQQSLRQTTQETLFGMEGGGYGRTFGGMAGEESQGCAPSDSLTGISWKRP